MPLTAGTRIGPYEVVAMIGAGGMGEVYRARDAKLNRDVALKVLPESLGHDPDRLARFRREAQVLASLNHPNIAHIHGLEDSADTHALVMELVEGQTLAERIAQGPMALADVLPIAKQIAEALESAHEQGIVHRDLKPANVKVRDDGTVKVLDFGLAKALDPTATSDGGPSSAVMNSPTLTARATQMGMILGTAAYMAPEQAKGRPVDRRADIWAFGVVLFEMLAGRRGFEAEDVSETLAAVLTREVEWAALPASTPARVRALIRDCLVRDPKQRLRDIGDARRAIERLMSGVTDEPAPVAPVSAPPVSAWRRVLPWAIAIVAVLVAVGATAVSFRAGPVGHAAVTRAVTPLTEFALLVDVSHDGAKIAYATLGANSTVLVLRMADQFEGKVIPGSEDGGWPLFSPDGQWIAYSTISTQKIKKIAITGGTSITLCDGSFGRGAAWGADGTIVFSGAKGLMRVADEGGTPEAVTTVDPAKGEAAHIRPQVLPDGRHLLFTITPKDASAAPQFAVQDLKQGGYRTVAKGGVNGRYMRSGHLTYVRDSTLFAIPFDLNRLATAGPEVPVVEGVSTQGPAGNADYSVSDDGLLVYFANDTSSQGTTLGWADRTGKTVELPGQSRRLWGTGRLSPDGRLVANAILGASTDLWVFDVQRGTATRLTFAGDADTPVWTRDSKRIFYASTENGQFGISSVLADGSSKPVRLIKTDTPVIPSSLSPDGRTLLYTQQGRIMMVDVSEKGEAGTPKPLHDTTTREAEAHISPDGRWVAYTSLESGGPEIYAHAFPGGGAKVRISTTGGDRARWAQSGRELIYWAGGAPSLALTSVVIPAGAALQPGPPKMLFTLLAGTTWDVTPDPNRFLIELVSDRGGSRLALVTNWFEELRRRAPAK